MVKFRLPEGLNIPSLWYKYISLLLKKNPKMDITKLNILIKIMGQDLKKSRKLV